MPQLPGYIEDGNEYEIPKAPEPRDFRTELEGFGGVVRSAIEMGAASLADRFALGGQDVPDLPRLTPVEIAERQKAAGVTFAVPSQGMTEFEVSYWTDKARTVQDAEERAAKASTATQITGGIIGSIVDPTILMPVPGLNNAANRLILKTGAIASKTGRIAARTTIRVTEGAIEGAVGAAVTAPVVAEGQERLGREYGLDEFAADMGLSAAGGGALRGLVVNPIQEARWRRQGKNVYTELSREMAPKVPRDEIASPVLPESRTGEQAVADARAADAPNVERGDVRAILDESPDDFRKAWAEGLAPEERARFLDADGRLTETGVVALRDSAAVRVLGEQNLSRLVDLGDDASDALVEGAAMASGRIDAAPVARQTVEAIADVIARSREEGIPVARLADVDERLRTMASEVQRLGDAPQSIAAVLGRFGDLARGLETSDDAGAAFLDAIASAWNDASAGAKLERIGDEGSDAVVQATLEGMASDRAVSMDAQVSVAAGAGDIASARAELANNASPANRPFQASNDKIETMADEYQRKAAKEPQTPDEARRQADDEVRRAEEDLQALEEEIKRLQETQGKASRGPNVLPDDAVPTSTQVVEAVRASLGDDGARWIEDGRAAVMSLDQLREIIPGAHSDASGVELKMTDGSRRIVLVAEQLRGRDPGRVLLHEIFHFQREAILGPTGWAELRAQVSQNVRGFLDAQAQGKTLTSEMEAWRKARRSVPSETGDGLSASARADLIDEETVAYLIETAPQSKFVQGIVAKVRAWLFQQGFSIKLTEADIRALAVSMMRRPVEMRGRAGARFSRSVTPRTLREDLRAATDRMERAEKLWPSALDRLGEFDPKAFDADDDYAAGLERMAIDRLMLADKSITAEDATALLSAWLSTGGDTKLAAEKLLMAQSAIVRRQAINTRRTAANFRQIVGAWKPDEIGEGLISLDDASMYLRANSRRGVAQTQKGFETSYKGYFSKKLGDLAEYAAGRGMNDAQRAARDLEIFTALRDQVMPDGPNPRNMSDGAIRVADAIRQTFGLMRQRGHDLGEVLGELEDWGLTQAHDRQKLQNAAATIAGDARAGTVVRSAIARSRGKIPRLGSRENFEAWAAFTVPHLDLDRMGIRVDPTKPIDQWTKKARRALESIYEGAAGLKQRPDEFGVVERQEVPGEIDDPRGVLQAFEEMQARRVIHFKDAASAFAYNSMFGPRDLFGGVMAIIEKAARSHGLRYVYGASPETARGRLIDMLKDHVGMEGRASVFSKTTAWKMRAVHDEVTGRLNDPVNAVASRVFADLRAVSGASKLASTGVTQLMDAIPASISISLRFGGNPLGESLRMLGRLVARFDGRERTVALDNLLAGHDSRVGEILRDQMGDVGGATAWLYDTTMKVGLVHYLDRTNIRTVAARVAHGFAEAAAKPSTMPQTERLLAAYGFEGPEDLRVLREASSSIGGRPFLSPENVPNVSREALDAYAAKRGLLPDQAADDLEIMLQTLISSEVSMIRMVPTARTRGIMKLGTRSGTFAGDVVRSAGQFKSYPFEYARRLWVEWPDALGGKNLLDLPWAGKLRMAGFMSTMIAGGLMVQQLKALRDGKAPLPVGDDGSDEDRAFKFADVPLINDQTLIRAITQAGVIPIYMDQILGPDAVAPSKAVAEAVMGPTVGSLFTTAMSALNTVKSFDPEAQDFDKAVSTVNADLIRAAKGWTPFVGHWATKAAMDRLVWWQLQEMASPGWAEKFEARSQMKGGVPYMGMRPSLEIAGQQVEPNLPEWFGRTFTASPTEAVQ